MNKRSLKYYAFAIACVLLPSAVFAGIAFDIAAIITLVTVTVGGAIAAAAPVIVEVIIWTVLTVGAPPTKTTATMNSNQQWHISEINNTSGKLEVEQLLSAQLKPDQPTAPDTPEEQEEEQCKANSVATIGLHSTRVVLAPSEQLEQQTNLFASECSNGDQTKCLPTNNSTLPSFPSSVDHVLYLGSRLPDVDKYGNTDPTSDLSKLPSFVVLKLHDTDEISAHIGYQAYHLYTYKSGTHMEKIEVLGNQFLQLAPSGTYTRWVDKKGYCSDTYNDCIGLSSKSLTDKNDGSLDVKFVISTYK